MTFSLRIFESEYKQIEDFVLRYPDIETGGDLFGLWTRNADPIIQLIIGPGAGCRRTSVSFHQDTDYLQNVGTYLNTNFMLCHVGSWHSHHRLSLTKPSAGDRSTVCNNFPLGLERYIMIIANIVNNCTVEIHPYMFTKKGHVCSRGSVKKIAGPSPFRENGMVLHRVLRGAENRPLSTHEHDHSRTPRGSSSLKNRRSPSKIDHTSYKASSPTAKHQQQNGYSMTSMDSQWYNSEKGTVKLTSLRQRIIDNLTTNVEFSRDRNTLDLTLEFRHNDRIWFVEFPKSFDEQPAKIRSNSVDMLSRHIVEDIQGVCGCVRCRRAIALQAERRTSSRAWAEFTDVKKRAPEHRCTREESAGRPATSKNHKVSWYNTSDGKITMETVKENVNMFLSSNDEGRVRAGDGPGSSKKLLFSHGRREWMVVFPVNFPADPVTLHKENKKVASLLPPLDVVGTLRQHCSCTQCRVERASSRSRSKQVNVKTGRGDRQWYFSDHGEKSLQRICTDISVKLLGGRQPEMSRLISSKDICLQFSYGRLLWRVVFPYDYPKSLPEIGYYDGKERYFPMPCLKNQDIVQAIRSSCARKSCQRYY